MKLINKKGLASRVLAELILGSVLVVILIALIYSSARNSNTTESACLQSLMLYKKMDDPNVIKCPFNTVNISSKDLADSLIAKEALSCWVKFGAGEDVINLKTGESFCYTCSIVKNSLSETIRFDVTKILDNLLNFDRGDTLHFGENNLKMETSELSQGDLLYLYIVMNKTKDSVFMPYVEISNQKKEFCNFEANSLR